MNTSFIANLFNPIELRSIAINSDAQWTIERFKCLQFNTNANVSNVDLIWISFVSLSTNTISTPLILCDRSNTFLKSWKDQVFVQHDVLDDSGSVIPSNHWESGFCKTRKMLLNRCKWRVKLNWMVQVSVWITLCWCVYDEAWDEAVVPWFQTRKISCPKGVWTQIPSCISCTVLFSDSSFNLLLQWEIFFPMASGASSQCKIN